MEPQPLLHQEPLVGWPQCGQGATVQRRESSRLFWCHSQRSQGDREHLLRLPLLFRQSFGQGRHAGGGSRVERLQHRQHIGPHPIAAESGLGVAGIDPEGQAHLLADPLRVASGEGQERAHQLDAVAQGATGPQSPQPPPMAPAGQIQEEGFGPVRGGVGRQHVAATKGLRLLLQAPVAPLPGLRFGGGRRVCPLALEGELLALCPGLEGLGLG